MLLNSPPPRKPRRPTYRRPRNRSNTISYRPPRSRAEMRYSQTRTSQPPRWERRSQSTLENRARDSVEPPEPPLHPSSANEMIQAVWDQLGVGENERTYILRTLTDGQLRQYSAILFRHRFKYLAAQKAFLAREIQLLYTWEVREQALNSLRSNNFSASIQKELAAALLDLRRHTIACVGAVNDWRLRMVRPFPPVYKDQNYLVKILRQDAPEVHFQTVLRRAHALPSIGEGAGQVESDDETERFLRHFSRVRSARAPAGSSVPREHLFSAASFAIICQILGFRQKLPRPEAHTFKFCLMLLLGIGSSTAELFVRHLHRVARAQDSEAALVLTTYTTVMEEESTQLSVKQELERLRMRGYDLFLLPMTDLRPPLPQNTSDGESFCIHCPSGAAMRPYAGPLHPPEQYTSVPLSQLAPQYSPSPVLYSVPQSSPTISPQYSDGPVPQGYRGKLKVPPNRIQRGETSAHTGREERAPEPASHSEASLSYRPQVVKLSTLRAHGDNSHLATSDRDSPLAATYSFHSEAPSGSPDQTVVRHNELSDEVPFDAGQCVADQVFLAGPPLCESENILPSATTSRVEESQAFEQNSTTPPTKRPARRSPASPVAVAGTSTPSHCDTSEHGSAASPPEPSTSPAPLRCTPLLQGLPVLFAPKPLRSPAPSALFCELRPFRDAMDELDADVVWADNGMEETDSSEGSFFASAESASLSFSPDISTASNAASSRRYSDMDAPLTELSARSEESCHSFLGDEFSDISAP